MSRPALSSRDSNIMVSPTKPKSRSGSSSPFKVSPTKRTRLSPTKHIPHAPIDAKGLNFTIFEDGVDKTTGEFNDLEISGQENGSSTTKSKSSFNEQENILQPKIKNIPQTNMNTRNPLQDLNISDFKGYVVSNDSVHQLTESFIPKTYKNDSNTVHKFFNYPSYVSPMKSNSKYLFKSSGTCDEINEEDELENNLLKKSLLIKKNRIHKRSFSVGKNDLKHNLIRKNGFTILSN